jgi:hypothetical protein
MSVTIENPAGATAIGPFTIPKELATLLLDEGRVRTRVFTGATRPPEGRS